MHVTYLYLHTQRIGEIADPIIYTHKMHLFSMINNAYLFASFQGVIFLVNFLISMAS